MSLSVSPYLAYLSISYPPIITFPGILLTLVRKKLKIGFTILCPSISLELSSYSINDVSLTPLSLCSKPGANPMIPEN